MARRVPHAAALYAVLVWLAAARPALAQGLPSEPFSLAGGHVVVGAEATATIAPEDPGFFNYTDYGYSALRNFRFGVSAEVKASDRVQLLAEVRVDQGDVFEPYGLYLRIRPWPKHRFDIQAGRIPPTFGAMTRSAYGSNNLLIGQPLAYQYLLSIRADAIPANVDELLRMRGRGWESSFSVGDPTPGPGQPIVNTSRWDTGVQFHGVNGPVEWTGAVTVGSLSDPRVRENNDGRQFAGRVVVRPSAALNVGVSVSDSAWLDQSLDPALPAGRSIDGKRQRAVGGDAEFSSGPFLMRGEVIRSTWTVPAVSAPVIGGPLVATSKLLEGRVKVVPGLYLALRGERLDFNTLTGTARSTSWEAATWRIEGGAGFSITRNILLKGGWQRNRRDGGRVRQDSLVTAQVLYWF
ncbi:MAG: hypothetical protein ABI665_20155 [Vicinamibacterales bacterium]